MNVRDTLERLFWTAASAVGSSVIGAALLEMNTWKTAALAGITAGINFITIVARRRLETLPDPGAGLPGLPTDG